MAGGQSGNTPVATHRNRWPMAVASLAVGAAFFALWFWLLPQWLGFSVEMASAARWRWLAAVPSVLGFAVALRCVWDFGWTGHGTPAPVAPPKRLVVVGFYRYVRNPMYVGFAAGWSGCGLCSDTPTHALYHLHSCDSRISVAGGEHAHSRATARPDVLPRRPH